MSVSRWSEYDKGFLALESEWSAWSEYSVVLGDSSTKVKLSPNRTRSVEMLLGFGLLKSRGASIVQLSKL